MFTGCLYVYSLSLEYLVFVSSVTKDRTLDEKLSLTTATELPTQESCAVSLCLEILLYAKVEYNSLRQVLFYCRLDPLIVNTPLQEVRLSSISFAVNSNVSRAIVATSLAILGLSNFRTHCTPPLGRASISFLTL